MTEYISRGLYDGIASDAARNDCAEVLRRLREAEVIMPVETEEGQAHLATILASDVQPPRRRWWRRG